MLVQVRAALAYDLDAPTALAAVDAWAGASTAIDGDDTEPPAWSPGSATRCSASGSDAGSSTSARLPGSEWRLVTASAPLGRRYDLPRRVNNSRVFRGRCKSEPAVTVRDPHRSQ